MSGDPVRDQVEAKDPLLPAAHAVVTVPVPLEVLPATLVEQHVAAHPLAVLLGQPVGADVATGFLVGDEHELQVSGRGPPPLTGEGGAGHRLGRDLGLHVKGSAPPEDPVLEIPGPGVMAPFRRVGENGVDVAEEAQGGAVATPAQIGDQVRPLIVGGQELDLEPGRLQVRGQVLDRRSLVARRIDRVETDQPLQDLGRLLLKIGRH